MATTKLKFLDGSSSLGRKKYRWIGVIFGLLLAIVLIVALLFGGSIHATALAGSAFGARIGCSCHYVEGRDLKDCRKDFEKGMGMVMLSADEGAKSVTARVPLVASQTATFHEGEGCLLEKWSD